MERIKITACAKINLSLSVLGKREDGYHELDTVMQSVDLSDTVYIEKCRSIITDCKGISAEENIAARAARLFCEKTGAEGCKIKIEKRIPAAAGLGGGSADAAAVLAGLNRLYKTGISKTELCEIAVKIGADVPFLIAGGTARARGIGEKLTPLMPLKDCWFLLAKAEEKPSTAEMFSRLDSTDYIKPDIEKTVNAVNRGDLNGVLENLGNSFEILWSKSPLKEMLSSTHPAACSLSGSGPARFAVYGDLNAALRARDKLSAKGVFCEICKPLNKSLIFE
ncbi:MAG TPA: 4-(cytidine 5'-diphospho)-2-C-methyl-D-erythritol kinase [Ruminococcaceae bacterium]|nr:4-(cytidine 5'-diphospho)-2-C-methyl-D-erythritol kinase [Oscillospiraceae bacterium]